MSWSNIDDRILSHPKMKKAVKAKGDAAWSMWSRGLVYTNAYDLDGRIPRDVIDELTTDRKPFEVAALLVAVGLWEVREDGDYQVHDFADYNDSRAEREARRQVNRERVKKSRDKRAGVSAETITPPERDDAGNAPVMHYTQNQPPERKRVSSDPIPSQATPSQATPSQCVVPAAPATRTPVGPESAAILAELRKHPALASVADVERSDILAGRTLGKPAEWVAQAIADAAADVTGAGLNGEATFRKVRTYVDHARAPKPEAPKPGDALTPEQVQAIQAKRGVQQGSAGPALDGNAMVEAMLANGGVLPDAALPGQERAKNAFSGGTLGTPGSPRVQGPSGPTLAAGGSR